IGLAVAADELSPTSYVGPRAIPNLFRGGKVNSGLSSLRSVESKCKGVVLDDAAAGLVWKSMVGGGNGNTDASGDAESRGYGICGNGDDSGVSGDGGGVVVE
ncbi:hypothetical protein Tco_0391526, partial [Tanacetum coccineum]